MNRRVERNFIELILCCGSDRKLSVMTLISDLNNANLKNNYSFRTRNAIITVLGGDGIYIVVDRMFTKHISTVDRALLICIQT